MLENGAEFDFLASQRSAAQPEAPSRGPFRLPFDEPDGEQIAELVWLAQEARGDLPKAVFWEGLPGIPPHVPGRIMYREMCQSRLGSDVPANFVAKNIAGDAKE